MYFLYVDESGDPGLDGGTDHYVLLGVAIVEDIVNALARELQRVVQQYPAMRGGELHFRKLVRGEEPFDRLSKQDRWRLADDVFNTIAQADVTLFAVVVNKRRHTARYSFPRRPDLLALEFLVERFDIFLQRKKALGCVVYDSKGKAADDELRRFFDSWRQSGTSMRRLDNIIETVFFAPSNVTRLLQVADFCAHATFLCFERNNDVRFNQIKDKFDKDPETGEVYGYGIKKWPP